MLFIRTKQNQEMLGVSPLSSYKTTLKKQLYSQKQNGLVLLYVHRGELAY